MTQITWISLWLLLAVLSLVPGCAGAPTPTAALTQGLTLDLLEEDAAVVDTCRVLEEGPGATPAAPAELQQTLKREATQLLSQLFAEIPACVPDETFKVDASACKAGIEAHTQNHPRTWLGMLPRDEKITELLGDPYALARRLNLAEALVIVALRLSEAMEDIVTEVASLSPYASAVVRRVLLEVAAEITAIGFEEVVRQLGRRHMLGTVSFAQAACIHRDTPGLVGRRILRRAILRLHRSTWASELARQSLRVEGGRATWMGVQPLNPYPLEVACRKLDTFDPASGCAGVWEHLGHDPDDWSPSQLVPKIEEPTSLPASPVTPPGQDRASALCEQSAQRGSPCGLEMFFRFWSLSIFNKGADAAEAIRWIEQREQIRALFEEVAELNVSTSALRTRLDDTYRVVLQNKTEIERIADCNEAHKVARDSLHQALGKSWAEQECANNSPNPPALIKLGNKPSSIANVQAMFISRESLCSPRPGQLEFFYDGGVFEDSSSTLTQGGETQLMASFSMMNSLFKDKKQIDKVSIAGSVSEKCHQDAVSACQSEQTSLARDRAAEFGNFIAKNQLVPAGATVTVTDPYLTTLNDMPCAVEILGQSEVDRIREDPRLRGRWRSTLLRKAEMDKNGGRHALEACLKRYRGVRVTLRLPSQPCK